MEKQHADIKRLKEDARQLPAGQRCETVSRLVSVAQDPNERDEAMLACVEMSQKQIISKDDLASHAQSILAFWSIYFQTLRPLQQDPSKLDWIIEDRYMPLRRGSGILLDLMGYLPISLVENALKEALGLTDPRLKMLAALSLLRNFKAVDSVELDAIGARHEVRLLFWEQLKKLAMQSLMPARWAIPEMLAASDLSRWASFPSELGTPPEEIEYMAKFRILVGGNRQDVYLFRFREFPKPWEPDGGWKAAVAGPCEDGVMLLSPWSRFESWNSKTPYQHFVALIDSSTLK